MARLLPPAFRARLDPRAEHPEGTQTRTGYGSHLQSKVADGVRRTT